MRSTHTRCVLLQRLLSYRAVMIIILALCSVPIWWNLTRPGFLVTDDGDWMLIRFTAFHQELVNGQFPVRWLNRLNNGYGYPVATFLYPGFMYIAELPKIAGFGFIDSIKILIIACLLASVLFTYFNLLRLVGSFLAFFGALFYIYQPYVLWDLYKRGSVGELFAFAVLPLVWYAITNRNYVLVSIGYALLIVAHNSLALLFLPMFFLYQLLIDRNKNIVKPFFSLVTGIGLASFFWLPAIVELGNTNFGQTLVGNWQDYFIGGNTLNLIIIDVAVLMVIGYIGWKKNNLSFETRYFLVWSAMALFLALPISSFIWRIIPFGSLVQFPFRFLSILAFTAPYLLVYAVRQLIPSKQSMAMIACFVLLGISSFSFIKPQQIVDRNDAYYATNEATSTVADEYMPKWVRVKLPQHPNTRIERIDSQTVQINTIYWPGFRVVGSGIELPIDYTNEQGLMHVKTMASIADIGITFGETPLRLFADGLSIVAGLVLIVVWKKRYV